MHDIKPDWHVAWSIFNSFPRGEGGFWAAWEGGELEAEVMDWFRARAHYLGLQDRIRLADERKRRWSNADDPLPSAAPLVSVEETRAAPEETVVRPGPRRGFTIASGFTYTSATGLIESADYQSLQKQLEQAPLLGALLETVNYDPDLAADFLAFVLHKAQTERVPDFRKALEDWLRLFARQKSLPPVTHALDDDDWRRIIETAVVQGYLQWQVRHCKDDSTRALCQEAINERVRSQKELETLEPPTAIKPAAARHSRQRLVAAIRTKIAEAQMSAKLF